MWSHYRFPFSFSLYVLTLGINVVWVSVVLELYLYLDLRLASMYRYVMTTIHYHPWCSQAQGFRGIAPIVLNDFFFSNLVILVSFFATY